ncbi:MAG: imidazole glycerol phosphate synthase subunit HisH [Cellulosilyticaceae bacterium]
MQLAIIDYGMGNLRNVEKAFAKLGVKCKITNDPQEIIEASGVVLPGVGAIKEAMITLDETGLSDTIRDCTSKGKPFLGICLGMQLMFEKSYENGVYDGLGLLPGEIVKLEVPLKVPHMGWNTLEITKEAPLFKNILPESFVYFVHSYYLSTSEDVVSAYTEYGQRIAIAAQHENVYGVQFHPEKSGEVGLQILQNFVEKVREYDATLSSN